MLALGLWGPVSSLIAPADAAAPHADAPRPGHHAAALPVVLPGPERAAKAARAFPAGPDTGTREARGLGPVDARPLSTDAFERRFPVQSSLSPDLASRFVLSKLLEEPDSIDPRSAFAAPRANALADAAVLHPLRAAARLALAAEPEGNAGLRDALAPVAVRPVVPAAGGAPVVLASLGNAEFEMPSVFGLPDTIDPPDFRPKAPARTDETPARPAALAARPDQPKPEKPTIEKPAVIGKPSSVTERPSERIGKLLAYARPDDPITDEPAFKPRTPWSGGKRTAVYDISAGVVHMPNGDRLEAHSGRGKMRDNPKYVHVKMRGPTPPSTYRLSMREALFHGVEAIRLTPVNGVAPHGRVGLLAHTYLLRNAPPGDSSGCVAFKDYKRFLRAYKRGEVNQLVVVASMDRMPSAPSATARLASLFSRGN